MGVFSWNTADTEESISCVDDNYLHPKRTVYLLCPDGTKLREDDYEGYGIFGGEDAYALLARWNKPEMCNGDVDHDRMIGIDLAYPDSGGENYSMKYPLKFSFSDDIEYDDVPASKVCKFQGYFYNEGWEDDSDYDDGYDDDFDDGDHNDVYVEDDYEGDGYEEF